jgi:2-(1,2-epoxy-1,2-dihydrophenyl)acetyl-CoA isomerase
VTSRISWRYTDGVAEIVLDSADRANALDLAATTQLRDVALEVAALDENGLRAVLIRAEGRHFCVGGDLRAFDAQGDNIGRYLREVTDALHEALEIIHGLSVPVVSAAQGAIAGAGVGLAFSSDITLLADNASIKLAYTTAGLSPDNGSTYLLSRQLGPRLGLELMLTNRTVSAVQAQIWGLAAAVVEPAGLENATNALITELLAGSTEAFVATKQLVRASLTASLHTQLSDEGKSISTLAMTEHARTAIHKFVQR